jgi:hypothetical protein
MVKRETIAAGAWAEITAAAAQAALLDQHRGSARHG